jgi:uncharacterized protein with HEPN domain
MSNEAYLIATDTPGPAGVDFDSDVGYDPEEIIAYAPVAIPVFWLSLFDMTDLMTLEMEGEDEDFSVPSLVAERTRAIRRLGERRELLAETFPEFRPSWDRFAALINRLTSRFVKLQMQEIWDMVPDDFLPQLEAAQRWFDTRSEEDFAQLLEIAGIIGYDEEERTYPGTEGVPRAFYLRGYASRDSDWDDRSDI